MTLSSTRENRPSESPTRGGFRSPKWLTSAAILGALCFGFSAGTTLAWRSGHYYFRLRFGSYQVITQTWRALGLREVEIFLGLTLLFALPFLVVAIRGRPNTRRLLSLWIFPLIGAALYQRALPDPIPFGPDLPGSIGGLNAIWPCLALGLQVVVLGVGVAVTAFRAQLRAKAVALYGVAIMLTVAGSYLAWFGLLQRNNLT